MATKRMFTNIVIDSDSFLDLTPMQQLLYFHMGMKTDDDGFVSGAKRIARIIGADDRDFAALVENGFLIDFPESKVFCIVHHKLNNDLKNDRYHETNYQQEYQQLELTGNKEWKKKQHVPNVDTECIQPGSGMDTECIQPGSGMDTERSPTYPIVTYPSGNAGEGSPEGGELLPDSPEVVEAFMVMSMKDGIYADAEKAVKEHGLPVAHAAYSKWRDNGKQVNKYNDYLKQVLKGE